MPISRPAELTLRFNAPEPATRRSCRARCLSACGPPSGISERLVRFWVVMMGVSFSAYAVRISDRQGGVRVARRTRSDVPGHGWPDAAGILLVLQAAAVRLTDCCYCFMGTVQLVHRFVSSFAPVHFVHWCNACTGSCWSPASSCRRQLVQPLHRFVAVFFSISMAASARTSAAAS